jgi:hypothetical protein
VINDEGQNNKAKYLTIVDKVAHLEKKAQQKEQLLRLGNKKQTVEVQG